MTDKTEIVSSHLFLYIFVFQEDREGITKHQGMMKKILLWVVCMLAVQALSAQSFEYDGLKYQVNDAENWTLTVTGAVDPDNLKHLVLPETVPYEYQTADDHTQRVNCKITCIGANAFEWSPALLSVKMSSSVESINFAAFSSCPKLEEVQFSESLVSIGEYAFPGCPMLETLKMPSSLKTIGNNAFGACSILRKVELNEGLESIGPNAFSSNNAMKEITIPSTVSSIGELAFYRCNVLKKVTFLGAVESVGFRAFDYSFEIKEVYAPDVETWCRMGFVDGTANPVRTAKKLYLAGEPVENVTVPASITHVPDYTFDCCETLKSIKFEDGVKSLGSKSVASCTNLEEISLGSTLETIGYGAFGYADALKEISFPESLISIGSYSFDHCKSLETINWNKGIQEVGENPFNYCENLKSVNITDLSKWCTVKFNGAGSNPLTQANTFLLNGEEITDLVIPDDIDEILDYAFDGGADFQSVTIPNHVRYVGFRAFWGSEKLKHITIGNGLKSLNLYSFGCSYGVESIRFEDGESHLSLVANTGWADGWAIPEKITDVYIGREITVSGSFAPNATQVTLGPLVTVADGVDFSVMKNLAQISALNSVPAEMSDFTDDQYAHTLVMVPEGDTEAYSKAEIWKNFQNISDDPADDISNLAIAFNQDSYSIYPTSRDYYTPQPLTYAITPEVFSWMPVTMESSNTNIVYIYSDFTPTFRKSGEVTVTAYVTGTPAMATCSMTAYDAPSKVVFNDGSSFTLPLDQTHQFELTITPMMIEEDMITWTSSDPEVLEVDEYGFATPKALGTATITATTYNNRSAKCVVTVDVADGISSVSEHEKADVYSVHGVLLKSGATYHDIQSLDHGIYIVKTADSSYKIAK